DMPQDEQLPRLVLVDAESFRHVPYVWRRHGFRPQDVSATHRALVAIEETEREVIWQMAKVVGQSGKRGLRHIDAASAGFAEFLKHGSPLNVFVDDPTRPRRSLRSSPFQKEGSLLSLPRAPASKTGSTRVPSKPAASSQLR